MEEMKEMEGMEPQPQAKKRPQPSKKRPQPQAGERLGSFIPPLPANYGWWSDPNARGNCDWIFDLDSEREDIYDGGSIPWRDLLQKTDFSSADHVAFFQNYPDFSPYLIEVENHQYSLSVTADFTFPPGSGLTLNRLWNYRQADGWLARAVRSTPGDISYLCRDKKFTWHELETCDRMILVPRAIHGNVPHGGGIEVLNHGGPGSIGAERAVSPQMRQRKINGMSALCGGGVCQIRHLLSGSGSADDIDVLFYCDEEDGEPTDAQMERMELLKQEWPDVEQAAWDNIQTYVNDEYGGGGGSAKLVSIVIFPEDTTMGKIDIGLYYENFAGDPEHGLGVRILGDQDDLMIAGSGDIAL